MTYIRFVSSSCTNANRYTKDPRGSQSFHLNSTTFLRVVLEIEDHVSVPAHSEEQLANPEFCIERRKDSYDNVAHVGTKILLEPPSEESLPVQVDVVKLSKKLAKKAR